MKIVSRPLRPNDGDKWVTCVPLVPLHAAAGYFSDPQSVDWDGVEWVAIDTGRKLHAGMIVAKVVGRSMERAIQDGSYSLFSSPVTGSRQGRTVLVELRDARDPETGERYTVKRYTSEKVEDSEDSWRHVKITLIPNHKEFDPIELTGEAEEEVKVVGELVEVLG